MQKIESQRGPSESEKTTWNNEGAMILQNKAHEAETRLVESCLEREKKEVRVSVKG